MEVTTQKAIHDRFVAVIQATVPTYPEHRQFPWVYCGNLSEVYGPEMRRFTIDEQIAEPVAEGLFSQGEEYAYLLEICVGYGGQTKAETPWLVTQDSMDLRTVLEAQLSPTCIGLLSVRRVTFAIEEDDEGHLVGRHVFEIHFMFDTMATGIPDI